jgi:hypothetical protein
MAEENTAYDWKDWVLDRFAVVDISDPEAIDLFILAFWSGC